MIELPTDASNTEHELVLVVQPVEDKQAEASDIPPDGTGTRHAYESQKANIRTGGMIDASKAKDILRDEFADYLGKS